MTQAVAPTLQLVYQAVNAFLTGVVPAAIPVMQGIDNRVPAPPATPGFVVFQALGKSRLRTAVDSWQGNAPTSLSVEQGMELTLQIDCYGPQASDWADMITTLWRDPYGCAALAPNCQPLYADDARMIPLVDSEEQYEERWSIDARLQYNPVVTPAQQFADIADITLVNVEEAYQ